MVAKFSSGTWRTIHGQQMHVIDHGPRQDARGTLVMVHGNPTWSYYFRRLLAHFGRQYRCIAPDHIGMGLSGKPSGSDYPYTLGQRIADLDNLLEQLEVRGPITLMMHDWGGMIGMGYAIGHRSRIDRLILLNTAAFRLPSDHSLPWSLRLCRTPILGALAVRGMNLFCAGALRYCIRNAQLSNSDRNAYLEPYNNWANRIAVLKFIQDIPLCPDDPSYACVQNIEHHLANFKDCPVQIFWGGRDFVFTDAFLDRWREILPQSEVHHFPEAGHYVLEDAYAQIIPKLELFLGT